MLIANFRHGGAATNATHQHRGQTSHCGLLLPWPILVDATRRFHRGCAGAARVRSQHLARGISSGDRRVRLGGGASTRESTIVRVRVAFALLYALARLTGTTRPQNP